MKLALISDIHANWQALQACLAHARQQGADRFAFLGDLVGYGADPVAVLDAVMDLAAAGALVVRGNHDDMACQPPCASDGAVSQGAQSAPWTHAQLGQAHREFLAHLPLTVSLPGLLLVHASADQPASWRYVDNEGAAGRCLDQALAQQHGPHVMVGHVHHQALYFRGAGRGLMKFEPMPGMPVPIPLHRPMVACVGSCGQPRDGDPRAMYALCDRTLQKMTFFRVPYNHTEAAAAIRRAGLPESMAHRLERGR